MYTSFIGTHMRTHSYTQEVRMRGAFETLNNRLTRFPDPPPPLPSSPPPLHTHTHTHTSTHTGTRTLTHTHTPHTHPTQEVRTYGAYETLNTRMTHFLEAPHVRDMFVRVLGVIEQEFQPSSDDDEMVPMDFVRLTLGLLSTAKEGLYETELKSALELATGLSVSNLTFPTVAFQRLMLRLDKSMIEKGGLRTFNHNYLDDAVREKYCNTLILRLEGHRTLAELYTDRKASFRKAEEVR